MPVVLRPPFWVPRPPDEQPWQLKMEWMNSGVLQQLTNTKFYGGPGQAPTKKWAPYYDYNSAESFWNIPPQGSWALRNLTQQRFYGKGGQVPTKMWAPYLTIDDPPPWQMLAEWMDSEAILHTVQAPFKPIPWRLNYDDSSSWQMPAEWMNSGVLQQLARVTFPLFTPFLWRTYYTQNDYSVWVGSPVGRLGTLYRVAVNPFVPQFPDLVSEDAGWQGDPQSAPLALLLTSTPPAVQEPQMSPFWAPRPPDDNIRNATPVASPINLLTAQPKPTVPIRWNVTLDDPPTWSGAPIHSATLQLLTAPGKAPTFTFRFGLDDPAYWQGAPTARNAPLYLATPFTNRKTWWYAEDPVWSGEPINSATIQLLTSAGQAKPFRWNHTLDDPSLWSGSPLRSVTMSMLTVGGQVKPFRWNYTVDDPPTWQQPKGFNLTLNTTIVKPFTNRWAWAYPDEASVWQPTINLNLNIVLGSSFPGALSSYVNTPLDNPTWDAKPIGINKALNTLFQSPFTARPPQWYAEDAYWSGVPTRSQIIRLLTAGGKPPTPRYQFNYDDASLWAGAPIGVSPYRLASFTPTTARPPQFYSEDAYWLGVPTRSSIIQLLTVGGKPPTPHYQFNYDDASAWTGTPIPISPYRLASFTPATSRPPQFYSEDAYWIGTPTARNRNLVSVTKPFSNRWPWLQADETAAWQNAVPINLTLQVAPSTPAAINFYVNTPLDDPTWQQPKGFNQVLNTVFANPFTARPPQFYSEDALWIGQPIARNTALYLAEPFSIRQSVTYFEDSLWTWQARRSPIISALTAPGKPPPFRPNFTYDDAGSWQPTIPTNLILLTTKFPKPFNLSSLWFNAAMFYDIDAPGWVGNPIAAFRSGVPTPPPPRTQFYEWIIRARRRGRR